MKLKLWLLQLGLLQSANRTPEEKGVGYGMQKGWEKNAACMCQTPSDPSSLRITKL